MAIIDNKLSPLIRGQLPDFLQDEDHAVYSAFVRDFYKFLESARIKYKTGTNYLTLEPETTAYVLSENGAIGSAIDRMVLEDSIEFQNGEIIKGQTSGAETTIIVEDVRNASLYTTANQRFEIGETILGLTSGAEAELTEYKGNPVQNIQQLLDYADIDNTVNEFFTQFREAFLKVIPNTLATGVSKRNLVKNIRDLYAAKGTSQGHKLFMRLLLNESSNIFYPNQNMLRLSDGKWSTKKRLRCVSNGQGTGSEALNQVITGRTSFATAVIDSASTFIQGNDSVSEFEIEDIKPGAAGDFKTGEIIDVISNSKDVSISFTIKSIVSNTNITNDGILHSLFESVAIDSNKGNGFAELEVNNIVEGSVSDVFVQTPGSGYEVGDKVVFTGGNGTDAAEGIVSALGGSILLEDGDGINRETASKLSDLPFNIALESRELADGPYYLFGTADYNQKGAGKTGYFYPLFLTATGAGGTTNSHAHTFLEFPDQTFYMPNATAFHGLADAPTGTYDSETYISYPPQTEDNIILNGTDAVGLDAGDKLISNLTQVSLDIFTNDDERLILERGTFATEAEQTSINQVFITNPGSSYSSLPTISVTSDSGSSAKLLALTTDIGAVNSLNIKDSGFDYDDTDIPDVAFQAHFILKDVTGTFAANNTLTTHVGTVQGYNSDTQQLDVTFEDSEKIVMENSTAVDIPFILEDQEADVNHHNILAEDTQLLPLTEEDNIILDGTSANLEPVRVFTIDVKHYQNPNDASDEYFIINGERQKQLLLKEGSTYYFNLSDPSLYNEDTTLNHQLKFSSTSDGTHGGGVAFTSGVTSSPITTSIGTAGAYIQIVVPTNAPTLYYYGVNHSGTGGIMETRTRNTIITDEGDCIIFDSITRTKDRMLLDAGTQTGGNELTGFDLEDDGGDILLESTNALIAGENSKVILDGDVNVGTRFLGGESGQRLRTEQQGNKIFLEDGFTLLFEDQDSDSIGDNIALNGTDSSSNNADSNLITQDKIDFSNKDITITDSGGATGTILLGNIATADAVIDITTDTTGNYISVQSLIDEDLIRIQDSYYYQQFSYEVQVGQSAATYLNELKRAVHPAGFNPFGKVSIASFVSLSVKNAGKEYARVDTDGTFSPILASTFNQIFDELIPRRHYVVRPGARIGNRTDKVTIDGSSTSTLALDGSDGSSSNAGSTIIAEDDLGNVNMIAENILSQNAGVSILCEDGTITMYGKGNRIFAETATIQGGKQELAFVPNFSVSRVSRAARAR